MYPYIRCFCGRSLGDIVDLYKAMRAAEYKRFFERTGIFVSPEKLQVADSIRVEIGHIFVALGLDLDCCRTRLLTQVEYVDVY